MRKETHLEIMPSKSRI